MVGRALIILLNPPAKHITIRDNYCSKVSQAAYINHPIDLVIQSGFLSEHFDVEVIDAIVDRLTVDTCLERIRHLSPMGIFSLAGNASWGSDQAFFHQLRSAVPHAVLVVSGDIFLENPVEMMQKLPLIDAIITDFTTTALRDFFLKKTETSLQLVYRHEDTIIDGRVGSEKNRSFSVPVPRHDLFTPMDYRYPFVLRNPFATVMTEFGCPFHCAFCVMGTLGHKYRPVSNVLEELTSLSSLGVKDVFFVDQSFGTDRARTMELCQGMTDQIKSLRWVCFSRVDLVDETLLKMMKKAGCHTIIYGVETADEDMLKRYRKGYTLAQVQSVFTLMRKLKLRSVATFLLGLPGETWESACNTIKYAKHLKCDFASLNVAVPRMGTDLRKWALEKGYIDTETQEFDQSGTDVVMETESLTRDQLVQLKKKAVRDIYLNPFYLLRRIFSIRSLSEMRIQLREGWHLVRGYFSHNNE
jgi:radical SAM superfamily enzyme YgiQ (UPF0313 family)